MKKGLIALVVIAVIVGAVFLMRGKKKDSTPTTTPTNSSTKTDTTTTPTASTSTAVSIKGFAFDAKTITVKKGSTVTWTNNDSATHTVTFNDTAVKSSGNLAQGDTYSHTFDAAGTFDYICAIHTSMTGTVVVTE